MTLEEQEQVARQRVQLAGDEALRHGVTSFHDTGLVLEPVEDIERTAEIAAKHGFQVNPHAIGDRGNREVLDIYERVWERAEVDGKPLRWRFEHAQHIDPADVPVEPINAIASYYASVSRMTVEGERFFPEQVMTREEALTSYTLNNAIAAFEEDIKGTLTAGKLADIVVLSQDLLAVAEDAIPDTRVDMTVVGGEIRFER